MKKVPLKNFLNHSINMPTGGRAFYESDLDEAIKKYEAQFKESSPAPALTEEDLKWLIFYGHNKDKSIVIDSEDTRQLDYAITQMFLMMKDSSRFDADGCEKLLWRRISLLLSNSREGKDGEGNDVYHNEEIFKILIDVEHGKMAADIAQAKISKTLSVSIKDNLIGYWFTDERLNEVTVISVHGNWCLVEDDSEDKPYVLSKEFIQAIKAESDSANEENPSAPKTQKP